MTTRHPVPAVRVHAATTVPARRAGRYVLYWMTSARRTTHHPGLQRARAWCEELGKPLLVLEPLRVAYPHACDRFHRFVVDGMRDNARALRDKGVTYLPFVERVEGEGRGLLEALARDACVVVGDEFPAFFLPRMHARAAEHLGALGVRYERVDSNGLVPLRSTPHAFGFAHQFRRFVQKTVPGQLELLPERDPLAGWPETRPSPEAATPPADVLARYRFVSDDELERPEAMIDALPIDHRVLAIDERGGAVRGTERLEAFVRRKLARYHEDRSHPDDDVASGLSFWMHFGHVSPFQVLERIASSTDWTPARIAPKPTGSREGWWNASPAADAFLDELITWREIGFARCHHTDDFDRYEGLPAWARQTLEEHLGDRREHLYDLDALEAGRTSDPVWNAAMRELRETGRIQNYVRMVWGKKMLEWTKHPREAFELLVHLNDKYAVDGRDPATYTNIGWVCGAYDRAWGPERPIFGKVRYMTSSATVKKLRMREWLARWGSTSSGRSLSLGFDD